MSANQPFDWIDSRSLHQWASWYCEPAERRNPLVSPLWADLRGLPPIYMQAGRAEILYDSIVAFAERARWQGANIVLELWDDMNHDFQLFGSEALPSRQALRRIGEVIQAREETTPATGAFSTRNG